MKKSATLAVVTVLVALATGCATISPAARIESRLIELGLSDRSADCLADELAENLDRSDLNDVADFLNDISRADSSGSVIGSLRSIDNPQAAATIAAAGIYCALGG